ncbi:hypothetical protein D3C76_252190 [compost metagenome]
MKWNDAYIILLDAEDEMLLSYSNALKCTQMHSNALKCTQNTIRNPQRQELRQRCMPRIYQFLAWFSKRCVTVKVDNHSLV